MFLPLLIFKNVKRFEHFKTSFLSVGRLRTVNWPLGIVRPLRAHTHPRIKPAQRDTREMREVCVSRHWEKREEEGSGSILGVLGGGWEPHLMMATLTRVNCCSALLIKDSQIILAPGHSAALSCWGKKEQSGPKVQTRAHLGFSLLIYLPSIRKNKFTFLLTKASIDFQVKIELEKWIRGSLKISQNAKTHNYFDINTRI